MVFKILSGIALALALPAASHAETITVERAKQRLTELGRQVQDRSTPDATLRAYFQHLNNHGEIVCLTSAIYNQIKSGSYDALLSQKDAIRDSFFTPFPVKTFHSYEDKGFDECMSKRETFSYFISGVEPIGSERTNIAVTVKNTTPLRPGMKPSEYDLERRKKGSRYRFSFIKQDNQWRIDQIEEWNEYAEEWWKEFKPTDLDPYVPSLIIIARTL